MRRILLLAALAALFVALPRSSSEQAVGPIGSTPPPGALVMYMQPYSPLGFPVYDTCSPCTVTIAGLVFNGNNALVQDTAVEAALGPTGSGVAELWQVNGNEVKQNACDKTFQGTITSNLASGALKLTGVANKTTIICGISASFTGTNTNATLGVKDGTTTTNCGDTSITNHLTAYGLGSATAVNASIPVLPSSPFEYVSFRAAATGNDYCFTGIGSTAISVQINVQYGQF